VRGAYPPAAVGRRWVGARPGVGYGNRWYRNRWGYPVAGAAVGLGYYGGYSYYDDCLAWDGYGWVNVCYSDYGGYGYW
jgi:hypothetical protein